MSTYELTVVLDLLLFDGRRVVIVELVLHDFDDLLLGLKKGLNKKCDE
jgi:hypothetical protein